MTLGGKLATMCPEMGQLLILVGIDMIWALSLLFLPWGFSQIHYPKV